MKRIIFILYSLYYFILLYCCIILFCTTHISLFYDSIENSIENWSYLNNSRKFSFLFFFLRAKFHVLGVQRRSTLKNKASQLRTCRTFLINYFTVADSKPGVFHDSKRNVCATDRSFIKIRSPPPIPLPLSLPLPRRVTVNFADEACRVRQLNPVGSRWGRGVLL